MDKLMVGEIFTMDGRYKRRTFWQWLRNEQRVLQQCKVVAANEAYSQYEESNR